jgi:predicted metal-dependent hydrolase
MATRKKKSESVVLDMPGTMGSAKIVLPKVEKGSHLTVTTLPDGKTVLEWDDEALLRDVQNALTEYENSVKVNTRATKVKKTKK